MSCQTQSAAPDIEECAPGDVRRRVDLRTPSLVVSVSSLLVHMSGYCEVQKHLRMLNGHQLLDPAFVRDNAYVSEAACLLDDIAFQGDVPPAEPELFCDWRRMRARMTSEMDAVQEVLRLARTGKRGAIAKGSVVGPAALPAKMTARFQQLRDDFGASFTYLAVGGYIHRKLEFADNCFVEPITFVKRYLSATRHYTGQMVRLVASFVNLAYYGKANEVPLLMLMRVQSRGRVREHILSGIVDALCLSGPARSSVKIVDYKTYGSSPVFKNEHAAQVRLYSRMLILFRSFPFFRVHSLLLRAENNVVPASASEHAFVERDMAFLRKDLRWFIQSISRLNAENALVPRLFESFRSAFLTLVQRPALDFARAAQVASMCADATLKLAADATQDHVLGEVAYFPRAGQNYHNRYTGVTAPLLVPVPSCHERRTREETEDDDELSRIVIAALDVEDKLTDPRGASDVRACASCEYEESCVFKPT